MTYDWSRVMFVGTWTTEDARDLVARIEDEDPVLRRSWP